MKSRMLIWVGRLTALVVAGVFLAVACMAANFSAQVVAEEGKNVTTSKVFVTNQKVRRESKVSGQEYVTIVRADKGVTWQLDSKEKTYTEINGANLYAPNPAELKKFCTEKALGQEKIAGYMCKKFLYIPQEEGGAEITVWMSDKLKWPLKVEVAHAGGTMVSEYRAIKEGKQRDLLFELPYDYKKVAP